MLSSAVDPISQRCALAGSGAFEVEGIDRGKERTFEEFAAVHLAGRDLESNNMALQEAMSAKSLRKRLWELRRKRRGVEIVTDLRLVQQLYRDADGARHDVLRELSVLWVPQRLGRSRITRVGLESR